MSGVLNLPLPSAPDDGDALPAFLGAAALALTHHNHRHGFRLR